MADILICDELNEGKEGESCEKPGGIGNTFYVQHVGNVASYSQDTTSGNLKTLTLKSGKKLLKFKGRAQENTAGATSGEADKGVYIQSLSVFFDYDTDKELEAIEALCEAKDLFVVFPGNDKVYKAAGLNRDISENEIFRGLKKTNFDQQFGTAVGDQNRIGVTLGGPMKNAILNYLDTSFAATKTALEALVTTAAT